MADSFVETISGRLVDAKYPTAIPIEDVAHALGNLCRFAGHTRRFYSVAAHSENVYYTVRNAFPTVDAYCQMAALLHDAGEAFVGDVPSPIRSRWFLERHREAERQFLTAIVAGIPISLEGRQKVLGYTGCDEIKKADHAVCLAERDALLNHDPKYRWEYESESLPNAVFSAAQIRVWPIDCHKRSFMLAYKGALKRCLELEGGRGGSVATLAEISSGDPASSGAQTSPVLPYGDIPRAFLDAVAARFQAGAEKYARDNWRKGLGDATYLRDRANHALTHLLNYIHGTDNGEDSPLDNLAAAGWGLSVLAEAEQHKNRGDK